MNDPVHLPIGLDNRNTIQNMIISLHGKQVMIDHDIAQCFQIATKRLNEQVKRNRHRFPDEFCFRLNEKEKYELVANCDRLDKLKHSSVLPYAFTEQGVAMLSAVIKSDAAIETSLYIMKTFVNMRKFILKNAHFLNKLGELELKQIQTENKVNTILKALDKKDFNKQQGIFFDGQVFDAHAFISKLIRSAEHSIELIDNYIDENVLILLSKKKKGVDLTLYTSLISSQFKLDIKRFNEQYPPLTFVHFNQSHDRFMIIDKKDVYHIGASLKDLGKKWFAFSKLQIDPHIILGKIP